MRSIQSLTKIQLYNSSMIEHKDEVEKKLSGIYYTFNEQELFYHLISWVHVVSEYWNNIDDIVDIGKESIT